jgi:hypothetical protein
VQFFPKHLTRRSVSTGPPVAAISYTLHENVSGLKNLSAKRISELDKMAELKMTGNVVIQLEGSVSDAVKYYCELRGSTLFVKGLNVCQFYCVLYMC